MTFHDILCVKIMPGFSLCFLLIIRIHARLSKPEFIAFLRGLAVLILHALGLLGRLMYLDYMTMAFEYSLFHVRICNALIPFRICMDGPYCMPCLLMRMLVKGVPLYACSYNTNISSIASHCDVTFAGILKSSRDRGDDVHLGYARPCEEVSVRILLLPIKN